MIQVIIILFWDNPKKYDNSKNDNCKIIVI